MTILFSRPREPRAVEEAVLRLHRLAARLKALRRTGWVERGVRDPETVASHSYAVALISILIAEVRGLDVAEVARMALLHDLPEAILGDLTPEMKARDPGWEEREEEAVERVLGMLPGEVAERWRRSWRRLKEGGLPEARLVKAVDKLEMGLQAALYSREAEVGDIYESALRGVGDRELRAILEKAWEAGAG